LVEPGVGFHVQLQSAQRKRNTLSTMKSAVIPQVRVEPELRAELESVLQQGETLSEFVEASVRNAVAFRRMQTRFHERGQVAWEHFQGTGASVPADEVLAKLQAKLDAKRKQLGK
jgi:Arc/MetJ-type ribon-helix-helix transcriptional regulator